MDLRALGTDQHPTFGPDGQGAGYVYLYVQEDGHLIALTADQRDEIDPRWRHGRAPVEPGV